MRSYHTVYLKFHNMQTPLLCICYIMKNRSLIVCSALVSFEVAKLVYVQFLRLYVEFIFLKKIVG